MTLLDACASFCEAMKTTLGPTLTEYLFIAALGALAWWQARKKLNGARDEARSAKAEARETKLELAELRGSLRPSASVPSSASSAHWAPVSITGTPAPRASTPDPTLLGERPLPRPADVPTDTPTMRAKPRKD